MSDTLELKSFASSFEIKDAEKGEVEAIIATLNTLDRDGDVILPGAIPNGTRIKLSAYGHDSILKGAPPAGVGTVTEENGRAILRGRFFMSTPRGQEAFATVKELGPEGEWSVGFPTVSAKTAPMTKEWRDQGARRLLSGIDLIEASPVFIGAQYGTGTVRTKEASDAAAEAARVAAEQAEMERVAALTKQRAIDEDADRRFRRPPAGIR